MGKGRLIIYLILMLFGLAAMIILVLGIIKGFQFIAMIPNLSIYVPIAAAVISIVLTKYYENIKSIEDQKRQRKIVVYERFINYLFLTANNANKDEKNERPKIFYAEISRDLVLWGSEDLIKKYNEFNLAINYFFSHKETQVVDEKEQLDKMFDLLSELLHIVRKDLGFKDENISTKELLDTFLLPTTKKIWNEK